MAAVLRATDVWAARRRRVGELRARYGFARQLLDFYGALLGVQEAAFVEAQSDSPSGDSLLAYISETVVARVVDVTVAAGPDRLRADVLRLVQAGDAPGVVRAWMDGDAQHPVERFLARASLQPVLEALGPDAGAVCRGTRDAHHCPSCGGPPQLSFFAIASEDLATGPRRLLCARCGTSWGYARMTCAGCGEDASARLIVFSERGTASGERGSVIRGLPGDPPAAAHRPVFPHLRIEACSSCRHYLLNIDLGADPAAIPEVDELSAVPLDLYAREHGYAKIVTNLMGF